MSSENTQAPQEQTARVHDQGPSHLFAEFMTSGWAESELTELEPLEVVTYAFSRRQVLSAAFPGIRLVLPAGELKVRAGDTDYNYRPDSAFAYYSGVQGADATADAVLILEPSGDSHITYLYMNPRSTRDTEAFYRDARYGELWVGRRFTLSEAKARYQIETRNLSELKELLADGKKSLSPVDKDFAAFISEQRLCKDEYEVSELQRAVHATTLGFNDVISSIPAAVQTARGERVLDAAFYGRARILGNDLGYNTIVGAGSHACVLHWTRNDGDLHPGELVLIDAGVEMESFYTADITRTFPINGRFSPAQRALYLLVYEAQLAGFAAVKPGALFSDVNKACQEVLARGLSDMGVLTISVEESMKPEVGLHRRWTLHGSSHHLGIDVHDCAQARKEMYSDAPLREGMVLTVEPGLYIQPDDELFAPEYRGVGIRIEDDVLVTSDGYKNLSANIPRHPDDVEMWMKRVLGR
ncbi:aminopeptidase P family protein [Candidatus Planktophila versatilis]|uniref:aminopeptidase P family protein n=1 Tax=Candidatus Planktophila versatilis TaxID=1884905 RepID=UPI000BAC5851|nr:aminopeptidase P family protein [Candidatus Planktophila versatilis]ASY26944.1 Xaa-Pro aminopeptidase [Candidatus Planktophila versatilis]